MFKKILIWFTAVAALCAIGAYFFFAQMLYSKNMPAQVCKKVDVVLLDSLQNRFVTKTEVLDIMGGYMGESIGKNIGEIDLNTIEKLLNSRSAIKESQASITRDGQLRIDITQRKPVLRIQSPNGGFYVDESQYIFPLVPTFTSYVPVVSGHIPFTLNEGHRGKALEDTGNWMEKIMLLGSFLENDPFWNAQIEQIHVTARQEIELIPRVGDHIIVLGRPEDYEEKFGKLKAFYEKGLSEVGWDRYSRISLDYTGQVVATKRKP